MAAANAAGHLEAGSAEREVKARFEASFYTVQSDVWQSGLPAAGPIRPSAPLCFGPATSSLDPKCASRKPPARCSRPFGSWQCRTGGKGTVCFFLVSSESDVWQSGLPVTGPICPSLPYGFSPATSSLEPSCARRKPPARRSRPFGIFHILLILSKPRFSWNYAFLMVPSFSAGCRKCNFFVDFAKIGACILQKGENMHCPMEKCIFWQNLGAIKNA